MYMTRLLIALFAALPATLILTAVPLVVDKAIRNFDITNIESVLFFMWPIGGILGTSGLWLISIKKNPRTILTAFLLSAGIISALYALIYLGFSFSFSYNSLLQKPVYLMLIVQCVISVIYLIGMWLHVYLTTHAKTDATSAVQLLRYV